MVHAACFACAKTGRGGEGAGHAAHRCVGVRAVALHGGHTPHTPLGRWLILHRVSQDAVVSLGECRPTMLQQQVLVGVKTITEARQGGYREAAKRRLVGIRAAPDLDQRLGFGQRPVDLAFSFAQLGRNRLLLSPFSSPTQMGFG